MHTIGVPIPGPWHEALNTDASGYGGSGAVNGVLEAVHRAPEGRHGAGRARFGQRVLMTLPPLGVVFLKPGPVVTPPAA